jgi:hypothetical protein
MSVSISALRSRRLLPGIAFLVAFFFLSGQIFNCCLVNENFGLALMRLFHSSSHGKGTQVHADADGDEHAPCHGHAAHAQEESIAGSIPTAEGGPLFEGAESCLSEQSFSGKPMLASDIAVAHAPLFMVHVLGEIPAPLPLVFERPRPQNKSSPPLYLTTLRILV